MYTYGQVCNETGIQNDWYIMGPAHNETGTQRDWYIHGPIHKGTGTYRKQYTMGPVHNGTGTHRAWDTMDLVHNGSGTQWADPFRSASLTSDMDSRGEIGLYLGLAGCPLLKEEDFTLDGATVLNVQPVHADTSSTQMLHPWVLGCERPALVHSG